MYRHGADRRRYARVAWRLKLKSISLQRRKPDPTAVQPLSQNAAPDDQALPAFTVIQGGQSPALSPPLSPVEFSEDAETSIPSNPPSRTDVADGVKNTVDDAEASRRALSHAARSTASVPSSADAVVEQRHV